MSHWPWPYLSYSLYPRSRRPFVGPAELRPPRDMSAFSENERVRRVWTASLTAYGLYAIIRLYKVLWTALTLYQVTEYRAVTNIILSIVKIDFINFDQTSLISRGGGPKNTTDIVRQVPSKDMCVQKVSWQKLVGHWCKDSIRWSKQQMH